MHARALIAVLLAASPAVARPFCSDPPLVPLLPTTGTRGSAVYETQNDIQPGDLACFKLRVAGCADAACHAGQQSQWRVFRTLSAWLGHPA